MRAIRWVLVVAVLLVVLLVAASALALNALRNTLPTIAGTVPTLNRSVAEVVQAAGGQAAVAVGPLLRSANCPAPYWTTGGQYERSADLYVTPGTENRLITTLADTLPTDLHVQQVTNPGATAPTLTGLPGASVQLQIQPLGTGWLRVDAQSGCRRLAPVPLFNGALDQTPRSRLTRVFAALHTTPGNWYTYQLTCPHGGQLTTVAAASPPHTAGGSLDRQLQPVLPHDGVLTAQADRVIYRDGTASVVVAVSDDDFRYTAEYTTPCPT